MATLNATSCRWENGGVITFDGDDVLHVIAGSITWKPCTYKNIAFNDRGIPQDERDGDLEPGTFEIEVRAGAGVSTDLYSKIMAAGSSGLAKQYTVVLKIPDNRASATGVQYTFAKVSFQREQTEYRAGTEFDTVRARATYITIGPTKATY